MSLKQSISTKEILALIDEELADLLSEGHLSESMYNRKSGKRVVLRAINQADRDICLFEKYEAPVFIYVPADRTTIFLEEQTDHVSQFLSEHSDIKTSDIRQYGYLISDTPFLDVISCADSKAYLYSSIPQSGEKTRDYIYAGTLNDIYSPSARKVSTQVGETFEEAYKTFFCPVPAQKKILLSTTFSSPRWMAFNAKIAPRELDILEMSENEIEEYSIICPFYTKAWLVLKTLNHLLPLSVTTAAGILEEERLEDGQTRRKKPGSGPTIYTGDDYQSGYHGEFDF